MTDADRLLHAVTVRNSRMVAMEKVGTGDALKLTGIDRKLWNDLLARGNYPEAPPTTPGVSRFFDRDDVVALFVLDHFMRIGAPPSMAGRVASAVRVELRKGGENLQTLWVVSTKSGTPRRVVAKEPRDDLIRHEIPVAELRRKIERLIAQKLEARA